MQRRLKIASAFGEVSSLSLNFKIYCNFCEGHKKFDTFASKLLWRWLRLQKSSKILFVNSSEIENLSILFNAAGSLRGFSENRLSLASVEICMEYIDHIIS